MPESRLAGNVARPGGAATLGVLALGMALPSGTGTGLTFAWVAIAVVVARHYQKKIEARRGSVPHVSNWNAAGVGCLSFLATMVVVFVVVFLFAGGV